MTAFLLAVALLVGIPHRSASARLRQVFGRVHPGIDWGKRFRRVTRRTSGWGIAAQARRKEPPDAKRWRPTILVALSAGLLIGAMLGAVAGVVAALIAAPLAASGTRPRSDPIDVSLAATWDLLAACLSSGMPVSTAVRAVAADLPGEPGRVLRDVADLLALGGDPVEVWAGALDCPQTAALARGARRTARSGTALAGVARELAAEVRANAAADAETRAQRAAVLVNGPLAICFLPAFLCLGIAPVVLGMAGVLSNQL
ncbi:type II secretion system F family protein [Actinokineospora sp. HUAS TT18]|uniref:type II secretion system F family protein n=1 Tax=Actinokineospora sp. HUAS TT18 TaxID=3447451 RepID=UPI003F5200CE